MSPPEPELGRLAAGQLQRAWLVSTAFEENVSLAPRPERLTYRVEHDHEILFGELEEGEDEVWATLVVNATIAWVHPDGLDQFEQPFDLSLKVAGVFIWGPENRNRELMEAWLGYNGFYLLWPYLRSFIAVITGLSSLPPLTIYTLRVPDPPPKIDLQEAEPSKKPTAAKSRASSVKKPARQSGPPRKKTPKR